MNLDRRQMLAGSAAIAAILSGCAPLARSGSVGGRALGLQLFTVRELFAPDPMGTLESVAAIGYREVEFGGGGYTGMDHAALRATMDRSGLTSPSIHVPYEMLKADMDGTVRMAKTLGADTIVLPWLPEELRTEGGWAQVLADLNPFGARLRDNNLGFAYHNHDFEFTVKHGGRSMFEMLTEDTDPDLVGIELDLFWAVAAGENPKAIIRSMPGRIYAYHVKDRTSAGAMTSVGNGTIDFADIFTLNAIAGVRHLYVENDQAPAPYLPDIRASFATLNGLV